MEKLKLDELGRVSVAEFQQQAKFPIVIVLDNIRSALNVGSAFRTADAFALEKIVCIGFTATPPHREILKTALGSTESVAWQHFETATEALTHLKSEQYTILAIEQTAQSIMLPDYALQADKAYALVFGNEVEGVSDEALALCDNALEIPQFGTKHSLNIAVCVGIVTWDFVKTMQYGQL
jgi:23S rRNA (guanosine2251-2'-O)-methyltransferase